ncbi:hypothetical protein TVAG_329110 [Trichomonas vaginalis G3]|uniref:EF hand family protein n=1 Tax=Trichomonas vaginalis (strain ATCC PRA-98 / G3) TaxID=412133 RepID=A2EW52_TRIV3|nr:EF-hand family [Trichomonas vaginalis G3]EAY03138.1 hypothetical protein TVAG_329110 [Trichomonas vaginalis G3]KAI5508274.1 EF-hand family [Trichomonas vaginalis G3]|eukprot:XP_001315361.1 hypothetical protein [Trichomonas vaginalis G3]
MSKGLDYSTFIEKLNDLDDDGDCRLSEKQFNSLLQEIPICKKEDFEKIAFNGLKDRKTNTIDFNHIRVLYEAAYTNFKCKAMLLILFRGTARNRDRKVNLQQYQSIAKIIQNEYNEDITKSNFENLDENKTGKVTYPQVALSLFGIHVSQKENPFKEIIEVRSPHTGCCLLL